ARFVGNGGAGAVRWTGRVFGQPADDELDDRPAPQDGGRRARPRSRAAQPAVRSVARSAPAGLT
ncbi:hypothetical protein, partial [Pseudonocardia lacus]|uniref:hypothetical protein n=1 Tax=Pseudonocardia lacus TaxID=2835865 RepID=UPI001BDC0F83